MNPSDVTRLSIDDVDPLVEPVEDKAYQMTLAALQLVPYAGGALAQAFQGIVRSPMERRQLRAIELMMDAINDLRDAQSRPVETLINDEAFVSTLFTSLTLAIRTAEPEKLSAIKQAVISSARDANTSEATQQMYLSTLAQMTSVHLKLLTYFKDLNAVDVKKTQTGERSVQHSYFAKVSPYLVGVNKGMIERTTRDLHSLGVIAIPEEFPQSMSGPNFIVMMLTDFGHGFLKFIEA